MPPVVPMVPDAKRAIQRDLLGSGINKGRGGHNPISDGGGRRSCRIYGDQIMFEPLKWIMNFEVCNL
jgi:hypothetical protein